MMGLATDGATVITESRSGVEVRIKTYNLKLVNINCVSHKLA
jgi:hypothetical protein